MIRIIGVLMLVLGCSFYGFYRANLLFSRKKRLYDICLFIETAADKIRLGEQMEQIVNASGSAAGIYTENLTFLINKENLKPNDISLASDFLNGLGMGDTEGELKRCQTYKELFKKEYVLAEQEAAQKAALYRKLGGFLGLLIGIVMI